MLMFHSVPSWSDNFNRLKMIKEWNTTVSKNTMCIKLYTFVKIVFLFQKQRAVWGKNEHLHTPVGHKYEKKGIVLGSLMPYTGKWLPEL